MDSREMIEKLSSLLKLDNDALESYDHVIDNIDDVALKEPIISYRDDHRRHVENLSDLIRSLGGNPPSGETDIRGMFLGGATALRNLMGVEGSLKALHTGEKMTNKEYNEATLWDVPPEVHAVLEANYDDERRHLSFVESAIRDKVWERR